MQDCRVQNEPLSSTTEAVVYKVKDKAPASASCCESAAKVSFANYFCTHIHIYVHVYTYTHIHIYVPDPITLPFAAHARAG